jgi:hypothetical protein
MAFNLFKRDPSIKAARKDNRILKVKGKGGIIQAKQARKISKINPNTGVISLIPGSHESEEHDEETGGGENDPRPEKDNTMLYWGLGGAALLAIVLLRK